MSGNEQKQLDWFQWGYSHLNGLLEVATFKAWLKLQSDVTDKGSNSLNWAPTSSNTRACEIGMLGGLKK